MSRGVGLALCAAFVACERTAPEPPTDPSAMTDDAVPEPPPARFQVATEEQERLSRTGREALLRGDTDTAVTAFLALRRTEPASEPRAVGGLVLVQIYQRDGNVEAAADVIEWLRATSPPSAELEFVYASGLLDAGDKARAAEALQRATTVDPQYLRTYPTLAALQLELQLPAEADATLVRLERAALDLGHRLEEAEGEAERIALLRDVRIGFPHPYVSRAARRALTDERTSVVEAALDVLESCGTSESEPALRALAAAGGPLSERAARLADAVATRP